MKEFFDIVPKALALLSSIVLILTVVHESGYFWIVGSHFQAIESAYDYLSNSILWLPQNLIAIFIISIVTVTVTRYGLGIKLTKENIFANDDVEVAVITRAQTFLKIVVILSLILVALFLIFSYFFAPAPLMSGVIALCIFGTYTTLIPWIFIKYRISAAWWIVPLVVAPAYFLADFAVGAGEAMHDLNDFQNVYIFKVKESDDKSPSKSLAVQLLRSFDKGLLARDPNANQIIFIRWDIVRSVQHFGSPGEESSVGCRKFPRLCSVATP